MTTIRVAITTEEETRVLVFRRKAHPDTAESLVAVS